MCADRFLVYAVHIHFHNLGTKVGAGKNEREVVLGDACYIKIHVYPKVNLPLY